MLYTRDEILIESTIVSDMERIDVMSSMMLENFLDDMWNAETEEAFTEASGNAKNTLKTMINSIISKIKEFIKKTSDTISEKIQKHKLKRMMSPEFKALLKKVNSGELTGKKVKDVTKLVAIVKKSESFIRSFDEKVADYLTDMMNVNSVKEKLKIGKSIAKFVESSAKAYDKIISEAEKVPEVELTVDRIYKFVESGITSMEDIKNLNKEVDDLGKRFQSAINTLNDDIDNIMNESTEEEYDMMESVGSVLQIIKSTISRALNAVSKFVAKHSKIIILISAVLIYIGGNIWMHNMEPGNATTREYSNKLGEINDHNRKVYDKWNKKYGDKPYSHQNLDEFYKMQASQKSPDSIKHIKDKADEYYQKAAKGGVMAATGVASIIGTSKIKKTVDRKAREEVDKAENQTAEPVEHYTDRTHPNAKKKK